MGVLCDRTVSGLVTTGRIVSLMAGRGVHRGYCRVMSFLVAEDGLTVCIFTLL